MKLDKSKVKSYWNERWAKLETPIPTKNNIYFVSDYGRIKSVDLTTEKEVLLKGSKTVKGYHQLNFRLKNDKRFSIYIHKFVAEHFCEKDDDDLFVTHLDGQLSNNHYKNLKWINQKERNAMQKALPPRTMDEKRTGKHVKLTESKVRLIKRRLKRGKTKRKILAKDFGISTMQLSRIARGENWGDIE